MSQNISEPAENVDSTAVLTAQPAPAFSPLYQQIKGLILAQHFARGDAEQQGVADLTSCTGYGDTDGFLAHDRYSRTLL